MTFNILLDYLLYIPFLFLFIVFFIFIGTALLSLTNSKKYYNLALPLGVLIATTITALISVNFKSVFIILLPFFAIFFIKANFNNFQVKILFSKTWIQIKQIAIPLFIIYTFSYLNSLKISFFPYFDICRDDMFYVHISNFISTNHVENMHVDWYLNVNDMGVSQYHYFEMYLNIFLYKISQLKSITTYIQFIMPISALIYYSSLLFLADTLNIKKNYKTLFFILLLAIIIPPVKFSLTFLPIILFIYALHRNSSILTLFVCAILLILNPIFLILVLPIHIFYGFLKFVLTKKINMKRITLIASVFGVYIIYIFIFKLFKGSIPQLNKGSFSLPDFIAYYSDINHYKTLLHYWFKYTYKLFTNLPLLSLSLVYLITLSVLNRVKIKYSFEVISVLIFGFIISIISSGLLHFMNESSQVFQFYSFILLFTLLPIVYFSFSNISKPIHYSVIFLLLVSAGYSKKNINIFNLNDQRLGNYSKSYFNNVKKAISDEQKELNVLRFLNDKQYDDTEHFNSYNSFEGYYLAFFSSNYNLHTFNMNDIKEKKSLHDYHNYNRSKLLPLGYDYNYFLPLNIENKEQLLERYLSDHKIHYIIIQKGAKSPSNLAKYIKYKIVDEKSGELFIILK